MEQKKLTIPQAVHDSHIAIAEKRVDSKVHFLRESGYRQDAIVFTRGQLEALEQTIYDVLYANPRDAFVLLPLNTSVSATQTHYSYRMVKKLGAAKVVADGAQDRPTVDVDMTRHEQRIVEVGDSYDYTIGNQEAGTILDFDYVQEKARVAAETIALAHNEYAMIGGAGVDGGDANIKGFYNNVTVAASLASLTDSNWTTVTGADAYTTVTDLIHAVNTQSKGVHKTTDVVLSTFVGNLCQKTLLNSAAGSQSVMSALRQNYPEIAFHITESGTARGAAGVDRCVAYERRSDRIEYVAAVVYDESSPDKMGFKYSVQSRGKMAGTIIRYPKSIVYGDITIA